MSINYRIRASQHVIGKRIKRDYTFVVDYLQSVILGLVEGATEYLPVSSTFHLIWVSRLLGITQTDFQKAYEVIIQAGAILAVVFLYWKIIIKDKQLMLKVLSSFLPTAAVGFILYKIIKNIFFENYLLQLAVFIVIGVVFILYERYRKKKMEKTLADISYKEALIIGLVQSVAVVPGVSRAGAVILSMMFLGIRRDEAAKFSFLLAIPTLLAASALDIVKTSPILFTQIDKSGYLLIGFLAAFLSALIVVNWFTKYLQKNTLSSFGWYRIVLGIILLLFLFG